MQIQSSQQNNAEKQRRTALGTGLWLGGGSLIAGLLLLFTGIGVPVLSLALILFGAMVSLLAFVVVQEAERRMVHSSSSGRMRRS